MMSAGCSVFPPPVPGRHVSHTGVQGEVDEEDEENDEEHDDENYN